MSEGLRKAIENLTIAVKSRDEKIARKNIEISELKAKIKILTIDLQKTIRNAPFIKRAMCGKKRSFNTQRQAKKVASQFDQTTYECPICHCWHTTSKK